MKYQAQVEVTGMKPSKFDIDGKVWDSTKVYVKVELDETTGGKGAATSEYSLGTSEEFKKFEHLTFPFIAVGEFENTTNGKTMKTVLRALKPVSNAPKAN